MVFESVVVDLLNKVLGDYVVNLDTSQLKIGIWGGDVVLKDLALKETALNELNLPVKVIWGQLGKLVLKIPWKNLYGAPVLFDIEDLFVLVSPESDIQYDPEKEKKLALSAKQDQLRRVEEAKKFAADKDQIKADDSFVEKLIAQIIKNVQIRVERIHIRYEDRSTRQGVFSVGATMNKLSVETTDKDGVPCFAQDLAKIIFKGLQLDGLSVYWNPTGEIFSDFPIEERLRRFRSDIPTADSKPPGYSYVFGPISSSARLVLNLKPELDGSNFTTPKAELDIKMDNFTVALTRHQFQDMMLLVENMDRMSKGRPFRALRPKCKSYRGHYRQWWLFAYESILVDIKRRRNDWNWLCMKQHLQRCREYQTCYTKVLAAAKPPPDALEQAKQLEEVLDVFNLVLLRQRASVEAKRITDAEQQAKAQRGWFSGWLWSQPTAQDQFSSTIAEKFETAMTAEEKQKLYEAIDYQENDVPTQYPITFVATKLNFILVRAQVRVHDEDCLVLLSEMNDFRAQLEQRPSANAIRMCMSVGEFTVNGLKQIEGVAQLVKSECRDNQHLIDVVYETNPLDGLCDQRIHLSARPLNIIYNHETITRIQDIFASADSSGINQVKARTAASLPTFKAMSAMGLQYAVERRTRLDVKIHVSASTILVPHSGTFLPERALLILKLGQLSVETDEQKAASDVSIRKMILQGSTEQQAFDTIVSESYTTFNCKLTGVQVLMRIENEDWESCLSMASTPLHLLQPTDLSVVVKKSLVTEDARIPKIKIEGFLPSISVHVMEERVLALAALVFSMAKPPNPVKQESQSRSSSTWSLASFTTHLEQKRKESTFIEPKVDDSEIVQGINLDCKFTMNQLVVQVSKASGKFLQLSAMQLEVKFIQKTLDAVLEVSLSEVAITQIYQLTDIPVLAASGATENESLVSLNVVMCERNSPELFTTKGGVLTLVKLKLRQSALVLHQAALRALIDFGTNLSNQVDAVKKSAGLREEPQTIGLLQPPRKLSDVFEEGGLPKKRTGHIRRLGRNYRDDLIDLRAEILVERVCIELKSAIPIARLSVDGIKLAVTSKRALTGYSMVLEGLQVQDLNPDCLYSMAVISVAQETINADIIMHNKEFMELSGQYDVDMSVKAKCGQLRLVYLQKFLTSILDFLNSFQTAKEAVLEASAAAAERAKQNMMKAYDDASKIALNINIEAPFIVVPRNNSSADALIIDMGVLSIKNHFRDLKSTPQGKPLLDTIQLALHDFKLYRAAVKPDGLQALTEHPLIDSVTFNLEVNRNLSAAWYKEVPDLELSSRLGKIQLALDHLDYVFLLSVLDENIGQGGAADGEKPAGASSGPVDREANAGAPAVHTAIMFTFSMDSFIVSLHPGGYETLTAISNVQPRKYGLGRFVLQTFAVKGKMFSDGSIYTSIRLIDCLLEDTREGKEGWLTTLMERKQEGENSQNMIDVTFQQKGLQRFLDVRVFSFTLVLSMDYLMKLALFFEVENARDASQNKRKTAKTTQMKNKAPTPSDESTLTFDLSIQKPDIILVEKMESIDTDALIFHTEINLKYRTVGIRQVINGSLADLELYSCCFNPKKRKSTMKQVIRPVTLSLAGSTPENEGLHLNLSVSPIFIAVSPGTIQLLSLCSAALNASKESSDSETVEKDWSSNWHPKPFDVLDYWFLKPDDAFEACELLEMELDPIAKHLSELCYFEMPSVIITVEAGVGGHTMPMLLLEMGLSGQAKNWSSNLSLKSTLNLGMQYFNASLGAWEPLVEPNEIKRGIKSEFVPWQLGCEVVMREVDEADDQSSPMTITLTSNDILQMTVTRTCLDVVTQLGESFANAVAVAQTQTDATIQQAGGTAYVVRNDIGFETILLLSESSLKFDNKEDCVNLKNGEQVDLISPMNISSSAPGRISYSSPPSSRSSLATYLSLKIPALGNANLKIPLDIAVKRLYTIPAPAGVRAQTGTWAIVAEVTAGLASTTVTLRSIIQIHNHFSVSIEVHYMTNRGNELEHVGFVEPHGTLNLPTYSIFTTTGEIFFKVDGYSFSIIPFVWKRLKLELTVSMLLQCDMKERENVDPFFIRAVGETEQIYMENTSMHTLASMCYDIHLLPTVELINNLPTNLTLAAQGGIDQVRIVPGAKAHVPHANPGKSSITLRIDDYLDKEWSCRIELPQIQTEVNVWEFKSYDSKAVVSINLGVHCTVYKESMIFAVYCPFWMINKTEKQLSYKIDDSTPLIYHPASYRDPIMLSPSSRKFLGKKKGQVKVEQGNWSDKFSLDVAGSSGLVECRDTDGATFNLSVTIQLTQSSLTKMVIFTPAYVIVNKMKVEVEIQEQGSSRWMTAPAENCIPLWAKYRNALLVIRVVGTDEQTPPFHFHSTHSCLLMLHNKYGGIYVDVQCTAGGVYINLHSYEPGLAPAWILNHTPFRISLREKSSQKRLDLEPSYSVLHAWQQPTGSRELFYLANQKQIKLSLTKDDVEEIEEENLWIISFLDGLQRVVLFTNDELISINKASLATEKKLSVLELNLHGFGLSIVNNRSPKPVELLYMGMVSSGILWETRKVNSKRWKPMNNHDSELIENAYNKYKDDESMGRSLQHVVVLENRLQVNFETEMILAPVQASIKRSFNPGLWLSIIQTPFSTMLHGKINRLQLDNQTHGAIFPVILAPVPPPKTVAANNGPKPFMEVSILRRVTPNSNVQQYKQFQVLIQEFHIKLDVGFVNLLSSFLTVDEVSEKISRQRFLSDVHLSRQPLNAHIAVISSQEQKDFYDLLHFSPLKIHLSFSMAGKMENSALPEAISLLLQSVGITLTDIQDAVFRLSYLEKKNIFLTRSQLISEATTHYSGQALRQVYVILLGLDVIGNPFGLVTGIGEGVEALFYEPFQGMIQGPGEFAEGLGLGVKSLFGHTVGGAAGAVGRITGTLGKGLAALSLDKEYQQQRLEQQNRSSNLQTSVAQGGRDVFMGVVHGVTGVVTKPLEGAREDGVGGFFKGMGKGVMGLVTRPVSGVVDFASTSLNAVKRATDHGSETRRLRPPRLLLGDTVSPYQAYAAEGNTILSEVENKRFANTDSYQFHIILVTKDYLFLTDKRIIIASMSDVFGTWQVHIVILWSELACEPVRNPKGIVLTLEKKKSTSIFSHGRENKLIPLLNTSEQEIVLAKMIELFKQDCLSRNTPT